MIQAAKVDSPDVMEVKIPILHHVNLKTIRMTEMIEWYGKVIGARKQFQNEVMGFHHERCDPGANRPAHQPDADRRSGSVFPYRHAPLGL